VTEVYRSQSVEVDSAGVLTNFENRSGAGVDFFKERPESFVEYEVSLLIIDYYYCSLFFYKACHYVKLEM